MTPEDLAGIEGRLRCNVRLQSDMRDLLAEVRALQAQLAEADNWGVHTLCERAIEECETRAYQNLQRADRAEAALSASETKYDALLTSWADLLERRKASESARERMQAALEEINKRTYGSSYNMGREIAAISARALATAPGKEGTPLRCRECDKDYADGPSRLCPGCQAYREHTGAI